MYMKFLFQFSINHEDEVKLRVGYSISKQLNAAPYLRHKP